MRSAIRRQVALFTLASFTAMLAAIPAARADETGTPTGTVVAQAAPPPPQHQYPPPQYQYPPPQYQQPAPQYPPPAYPPPAYQPQPYALPPAQYETRTTPRYGLFGAGMGLFGGFYLMN